MMWKSQLIEKTDFNIKYENFQYNLMNHICREVRFPSSNSKIFLYILLHINSCTNHSFNTYHCSSRE